MVRDRALVVVSFFSRSVEQNAQETKLTKRSPFFLRLAALLARAWTPIAKSEEKLRLLSV